MPRNRRLKAARVFEGLTQLQLAEKAGCREIEVSRFETGRAHPDEKTKQSIAAILGRRVYELFSE